MIQNFLVVKILQVSSFGTKDASLWQPNLQLTTNIALYIVRIEQLFLRTTYKSRITIGVRKKKGSKIFMQNLIDSLQVMVQITLPLKKECVNSSKNYLLITQRNVKHNTSVWMMVDYISRGI